MLPSPVRMRRSDQFRGTVRSGRRGASASLVVHLRPAGPGGDARLFHAAGTVEAAVTQRSGPAAVGFVVGRSVGTAVVRNQVRRRLRHLMASRLTTLPAGAQLVVRALPAAAGRSAAALGRDLDAALRRAVPG